ncbi:MAG: cytochrome C, partial [Planctomycetota bacterium]
SQRILQERAYEKTLDLESVQPELEPIFASDSQRDRLRALWTMWCVDAISDEDLIRLLDHADEHVRGWAVHFAGESAGESLRTTWPIGEFTQPVTQRGMSQVLFAKLVTVAESDRSLIVQRHLASLLQDLPFDLRWSLLDGLTSHSINQRDRNIPYLVWFGCEPLVGRNPARAYQLAKQSGWETLWRNTIRRTAVSPEGREFLTTRLAEPRERRHRLAILETLQSEVARRRNVSMPTSWPNAYQQLSKASLPRVKQLARNLAFQFGDRDVLPFFRETLGDLSRSKRERLETLAMLRSAKDEQLQSQLLTLLDDAGIQTEALNALAAFEDPRIASTILDHFDSFTSSARTAALSALVSRRPHAEYLVTAMENGDIDASTVPAFIVRQAVAFEDERLNSRLESVWGRISKSSDELKAQYARYRKLLRPGALGGADASHGRLLYEANCGKCHRLFGEGGDIGPDITGANRSSVDYWLENILEPNALIGRAYQTTRFLTADGRLINGVVQERNEDAVVVQTATERMVIAIDDIEEELTSDVSLMPAGQLEPMQDRQVLALFRYLMSPNQVPRPKTEAELASTLTTVTQ